MNVSCACCSRCLHLELSFCRLQIVQTLSANASIANQACFGPHDSRMFWHGCSHNHPCFSRTFCLADFLGSFFTLVANVVTDLVAGKITKDYNGLNLKRLALFRFKTRGIFWTYTLLSNRTDSKIGFFPKEGVDEALSIELQLWRCKRLSLHKEEKKNDRKNEKKIEYSI